MKNRCVPKARVLARLLTWAPLAGLSLMAVPAYAAGMNNSPPSGAILDLGGGETGTAAQSVNHGAPIQESVSFVAAQTTTDITFAFREDPAFISFSNVSLIDTTTVSGNLLLNSNFAGGVYTSGGNDNAPIDWNFDNVYGAEASGVVTTCSGFSGTSNCWYDGSVQAYDAIDQDVTTTVGNTYTLSFFYTDNSELTTMSDLSTNGDVTDTGGTGIDILAYAQAGLPVACDPGVVCTTPPTNTPPPTTVPEPMSIAMLGVGLFGLGIARRVGTVRKT